MPSNKRKGVGKYLEVLSRGNLSTDGEAIHGFPDHIMRQVQDEETLETGALF